VTPEADVTPHPKTSLEAQEEQMAARARKDVWHKLTLAHFAGNPVYFFDTRFLLSKVPALAGWSAAKLEAALAPLVEPTLGNGDTRYITETGFYVLFGSFDPFAAQETASEISADILGTLLGPGDYSQEIVQRLCAQSSVQNLVEDLGVGVPSPPKRSPSREEPEVLGDLLERRNKKPFAKELTEIYREYVSSEDNKIFAFWPCWDSQRQRITSFTCEIANRSSQDALAISTAKSLSPATTQCRLDIAALATASRGIRRIVRRCEPGFVSVPVHVETLSWSKTRDAYLSVLSQIDAKALSLMALRIGGFGPGADLSLVPDWIAQLRPHVRGVSIELSTELDKSYAGIPGLTGFNLTITDEMRSRSLAGEALVDQIARLKRVCHSQSAIASIHNVATLPELYLVKAHGIRIVSGPAIESQSPMPGRLRPLSFESMSADTLQGEDRDTFIRELENDVERAILRRIAQLAGPQSSPGPRHSGQA
jgi:hypothetical protein